MCVVFYGGWSTYAAGRTAAEAERKASLWVWGAVEKRTDLWAVLARCERAVDNLVETLRG